MFTNIGLTMRTHEPIGLIEALQLAGFLPCVFLIGLLLVIAKKRANIVVPILFFASLSAGFLAIFFAKWPISNEWRAIVMMVDSLQPACCFLLVSQLITGRVPAIGYWLLLLVPIVGGGAVTVSALYDGEYCFRGSECLKIESIRILYHLFASSLIFLLLLMQFSSYNIQSAGLPMRKHRYWLIMSFISMYLLMLVLDLMFLSQTISDKEHQLAQTFIRVSVIYFAFTSVFRLFDHHQPFKKTASSYRDKPVDPEFAQKIKQLMEDKKSYLEMGFSRDVLAQQLGVGEHTVSKVINQAFGKNFNEFVNGYRIEAAKKRLADEQTPVTVIAFEVGFSSIASFNRVFKAMVGSSPTEFRVSNAATKIV